jgi:dimethylargininase
VAAGREQLDGRGDEADAVLARLDFGGAADDHFFLRDDAAHAWRDRPAVATVGRGSIGAVPTALTRGVAATLAACELTHVARAPIDVDAATRQHAAYVAVLRALGFSVVELPADDAFPDCVFVEDTAVVVDEVAVATRPGAASRRGEVDAVAAALGGLRRVVRVAAPATIDGGDVVVDGRRVFVGRTARTNEAGVAALADALGPFGYAVRGVDVRGCLHLKTGCTALGDGRFLVNPTYVDPADLGARAVIEVDGDEPAAANGFVHGDVVVHAAEHARTAARLAAAGFRVVPVANAELAKAEGGVTCCSLRLR